MSAVQPADQQPQEEQPQERTKWITYMCPFCGKQPFTHSQQSTYNERTGQHYIKTKYVCISCDVHLSSQVPRKLATTVIDERYLPPPVATA